MRESSIETVYVGYYSDGTKDYDVFKNTQINYFTPKKTGISIPIPGFSSYHTSDGQPLQLVGDDLVLENGDILTLVEL
ncbi:hypothetical protein JKP23_00790 [Vibrio vulnificus]|uniref:hypothetical protein n=1 Tax=Vibrio vulnificus TaxID=672 RepID=UPI001CDD1C50|nr:hypothetical protein [Vibrio vulnificus]MCA3895620.1 hypothetical protein [Vibrio vulnificus]